MEGLEDSAHPCTTVLSVAGLLVTIGPFPVGGGVYSEVRMDPFPPA